MFRSIFPNRSHVARFSFIHVFFVVLLWMVLTAYPQTAAKVARSEKIEGKVFAKIELGTYGSGVGPKYQSFIYQTEPKTHLEKEAKLIRVIYQFWYMDDRLQKQFFDYSKTQTLTLFPDPSCDEAPINFGYQTMESTNAKERMSIIMILPGADGSSVREDLTMPCYVMKAPDSGR